MRAAGEKGKVWKLLVVRNALILNEVSKLLGVVGNSAYRDYISRIITRHFEE